MRATIFILGLLICICSGCTVVSANRVFPTVKWYWSKDAKMQREYNRVGKELSEEWKQKNSK